MIYDEMKANRLTKSDYLIKVHIKVLLRVFNK